MGREMWHTLQAGVRSSWEDDDSLVHATVEITGTFVQRRRRGEVAIAFSPRMLVELRAANEIISGQYCIAGVSGLKLDGLMCG